MVIRTGFAILSSGVLKKHKMSSYSKNLMTCRLDTNKAYWTFKRLSKSLKFIKWDSKITARGRKIKFLSSRVLVSAYQKISSIQIVENFMENHSKKTNSQCWPH